MSRHIVATESCRVVEIANSRLLHEVILESMEVREAWRVNAAQSVFRHTVRCLNKPLNKSNDESGRTKHVTCGADLVLKSLHPFKFHDCIHQLPFPPFS